LADESAPSKTRFDVDDRLSPWDRAPDEVKSAIARAVTMGTPALSVAFYARWWQLETWLRQLLYLEFRAKWGSEWADHLVPAKAGPRGATPSARATQDTANAYMATPDATNVLSYMDVSILFELIDEHWELFEKTILPKKRWDGWVDEIKQVRHRSAHCRRPHSDDLSRIELLLRDLEGGAWTALTAHNVRSDLDRIDSSDPVVAGWVKRKHKDAPLADHAARTREVELGLTWSKRPWADYRKKETIAGRAGFLIHATFYLQSSYVLPRALWEQFKNPADPVGRGLVYLIADSPYSPSFTFAAVDGGESVNDQIASALEGVLMAQRPGRPPDHWLNQWQRQAARLDHRVLVDSALALAYPDTPFSVF
jgi:hypothetical protein